MKKLQLYLVVLLTVMIASCSKSNSGGHSVKYTIGGTAKLNVIYTDKNGNTQTASNVDSTWTYSFSGVADGKMVYLKVASVDSSAVEGRIYVDNQQSTQDNSSSGSISISTQVP